MVGRPDLTGHDGAVFGTSSGGGPIGMFRLFSTHRASLGPDVKCPQNAPGSLLWTDITVHSGRSKAGIGLTSGHHTFGQLQTQASSPCCPEHKHEHLSLESATTSRREMYALDLIRKRGAPVRCTFHRKPETRATIPSVHTTEPQLDVLATRTR